MMKRWPWMIVFTVGGGLAACGGSSGNSATGTDADGGAPDGSVADGDTPDGAPESNVPAGLNHPRLWITPADLPVMKARVTSQNPIYGSGTTGLSALLASAEAMYSGANAPGNAPFMLPDGTINPQWPDQGGSSVGAPYSEALAEIYAFMALASPSHAAVYAQKARNLFMYGIDLAANCGTTTGPFCETDFATFNRSNYVGEAWGLTADWLQAADPGGQIYTSADRAKTRTVFLSWAKAIVNNEDFAPDPTLPLLAYTKGNNQVQLRIAANNYSIGNTRDLTLMALSLDAADDPPLDGDPTHVDVLGNTLRSYVPSYVLPVRLYQQYAMFEKASVVAAAYGLSNPPPAGTDTLGLASGGLPVEGFLYGESLGFLMQELLGLHTSGRDSVVQDGGTYPQLNLINSTYWDEFEIGMISSLAPQPVTMPAGWASELGNDGKVYQMAAYGDVLQDFVTDYGFVPVWATLDYAFQKTGRTADADIAAWVLTQSLPSGHAGSSAANLPGLLADELNSLSTGTPAILSLLALDPAKALSSYPDPRPSWPTTFVSPPIGRVVAHSDWTASASMFTHICGWDSINHEDGTCGQFELYRKGEWLFKERSGYDNGPPSGGPAIGYAPESHNIVGIENLYGSGFNPQSLSSQPAGIYSGGGQWNNGEGAGDPVTVASYGDSYVYTQDISTNLYNYVPNRAYMDPTQEGLDVVHASRSMVWVKPDHIVVYDRAETQHDNLFKRFNLVMVENPGSTPSVNGNLVSGSTAGGQELFVHALLPAAAAVSVKVAAELYPTAWVDPTEDGPVVNNQPTPSGYLVQVESATAPTPANVHFLTVVQGADPGATADPATLLQSSAGTAMDGATIQSAAGNVAVLFISEIASALPSSWTSSVPLGSVSVPAGRRYVADLQPNTMYCAAVTASTLTIGSSSGGACSGGTAAAISDSAGLLVF